MADYMAAQITIGGRVLMALVPELCHRICDLGLSADDDQTCFKPASADDLLAGCQEIDGVRLLQMCDSEAYFGQFACLEAFLQKKGITYRRQSDGKYEHDAEVVEFRPHLGLVRTPASKSGEPLASLSTVSKAITCLVKVQSLLAIDQVAKAKRTIERCRSSMARKLPPSVPRLRPFELA